MKKLFLMMVIGLGAAFAAQAQALLYFSVSAFDWSGVPKLFDFAMLGIAKEGKTDWGDEGSQVYAWIYPSHEQEGGSFFIASEGTAQYSAAGWADISDYTTSEYTFYVETYKNTSDDPIITYSEDTAKSYAQLKDRGSIYIPGQTDPQDVKPWNVPEPTSGLLSLFALAALALKRKRA